MVYRGNLGAQFTKRRVVVDGRIGRARVVGPGPRVFPSVLEVTGLSGDLEKYGGLAKGPGCAGSRSEGWMCRRRAGRGS